MDISSKFVRLYLHLINHFRIILIWLFKIVILCWLDTRKSQPSVVQVSTTLCFLLYNLLIYFQDGITKKVIIKMTRCSTRENRETALLHVACGEPRETALLHGCKVQLHQLIACIFIYSTKWPYVKTMNAKNSKKITDS